MTQNTTHQSPWPACADCQVNAPDDPSAEHASGVTKGQEQGDDPTCDDIPLSQDFGPWAAEVRRRAADAMARAMARAHNDMTTKDTSEKRSTEPRRA